MFGYITPDKPELKIWEFEVFRGYYCGVCKAIAKQAGHIGRICLSYDTAFLALLLDSLKNDPVKGKQQRCFVHPVQKRFMAESNPAVEFASDINILLAYYNLKDKWQDEKKLSGPIGTAVLRKGFRRVKRKYPVLVDEVNKELSFLVKLEKESTGYMDEASEPFSRIMQIIFSFPETDEKQKKALGWIGYNLGKWIYLLDAYDDLEDNIKSGAYNPLLTQFQYKREESVQDFRDRIREKTYFNLIYTLSEMEKAFSLLDVKKNKSILENIVYSGLLLKTRNVLKIEDRSNKNEKSL